MLHIKNNINKNEPLISIIVPIFQVEKHLDKCISSIKEQTYKNIEIILIDDGSRDNSPDICDKYKSSDNRIKVIHKYNEGLSSARNNGIILAKGDFIGFVDGDDWIEPNMYEYLMTAIRKSNADIAVCNYKIESDYGNEIKHDLNIGDIKQYTSEEALRQIINSEGYIKSYVWNKLYRRDVLFDVFFPEGKIYEDTLWTTKVIDKAKLIVCIDNPLYHYLYRKDSLSHCNNQIKRRINDIIEMYEKRIEYIKKFHPNLFKDTIVQFKNLCCIEYLNVALYNSQYDNDGFVRNKLNKHFKQYGRKFVFTFDKLIMLICRVTFWINPNLLIWIYKKYKRIS